MSRAYSRLATSPGVYSRSMGRPEMVVNGTSRSGSFPRVASAVADFISAHYKWLIQTSRRGSKDAETRRGAEWSAPLIAAWPPFLPLRLCASRRLCPLCVSTSVRDLPGSRHRAAFSVAIGGHRPFFKGTLSRLASRAGITDALTRRRFHDVKGKYGRWRHRLQRDAPGIRRGRAPHGARRRHLEDPHPPQAPDRRLVPDPDGQR